MVEPIQDRRTFLGWVLTGAALATVAGASALVKELRPEPTLDIEDVVTAIKNLSDRQEEMLAELPAGILEPHIEKLFSDFFKELKPSLVKACPEVEDIFLDKKRFLKILTAQLEKQGYHFLVGREAFSEDTSLLIVELSKVERINNPDFSIFEKVNIRPKELPELFFVYPIVTTNRSNSGATEVTLGTTRFNALTEKDEVLIYPQALKIISERDKVKETLELEITIANELGNYTFTSLLEGLDTGQYTFAGVGVTLISEAFSDMFSLQAGGVESFALEVARIHRSDYFNYKLSQELLQIGVENYAKSVGREAESVIHDLTVAKSLEHDEAEKLREFVVQAYLQQNVIQFTLDGSLKQYLEPVVNSSLSDF